MKLFKFKIKFVYKVMEECWRYIYLFDEKTMLKGDNLANFVSFFLDAMKIIISVV